jgi:eukaryotic-like serine/threonine-protein kinase
LDDDLHKQITKPGVRPAAVSGPEKTPERIGPYKIEGRLSKGGMSRLYLAVDPATHDPVSVKVMSPEYVNHPEMKGRFHREAEIIQMTDHPNLCKLYGHGEWEGGLYIAMEFVQGISLRQSLLQHTTSLKRALELLLQVAAAIRHLHSHGVIHRDIKPENILLTSTGGIKVVDFGIAQLHEEREAEGVERRVIGTPVYMAPEQKEYPNTVTFAADIYSLGIVAYELALGRLSHGIIHLSQVPRGLQKILSKALQPDPHDRYQTVAAFMDDITAYLESGKIEADQRGRAYTQDIAEHLRAAQETLLPPALPSWREVSIGLSLHRDLNISGVYYDFLELEEGAHGIVLAEPSSKGVAGIMHAAMLQGLMLALARTIRDPSALITAVNDALCAHTVDEIFSLNYLILKPRTNELHYISCGYGPLWMVRSGTQRADLLTSDNIGLGIEPGTTFLGVTQKWSIGDSLYLATFRAAERSPQDFGHVIEQVLYTTPQKQADSLLRRLLVTDKATLEQRPAAIVAVQRIA